jgi:hypothetical protein
VNLSGFGHNDEVSIEVAGAVVRRRAAAGAVRWWLDSPARTEFRDPEEVVGCAGEEGGEAGALHAAIARAAKVADRFEPAEDLFDPLAHAAGGWIINYARPDSSLGTLTPSDLQSCKGAGQHHPGLYP